MGTSTASASSEALPETDDVLIEIASAIAIEIGIGSIGANLDNVPMPISAGLVRTALRKLDTTGKMSALKDL
jgi:hypothetical protein